MVFAVFAKHLQAWPLEECASRVKAAGFDGLDLTVRPGGYVEPGDGLAARLAGAVKQIRAAGLSVPLITTGITSARDPDAAAIIGTAGELGIRELKLHYWPWDGSVSLPQAVDAARRELDALAGIGRRAGVRINLHNHSGPHVTHAASAMDALLHDHEPTVVGAYIDPAHFALEGGMCGWQSSLMGLAPRATLLAVKDFRWVDSPMNPAGPQERRWSPVGTGNVPWPKALEILQTAGFSGPASIHGEYQGRWAWRDLTVDQVLEQCVKDLAHIKRCLAQSSQIST